MKFYTALRVNFVFYYFHKQHPSIRSVILGEAIVRLWLTSVSHEEGPSAGVFITKPSPPAQTDTHIHIYTLSLAALTDFSSALTNHTPPCRGIALPHSFTPAPHSDPALALFLVFLFLFTSFLPFLFLSPLLCPASHRVTETPLPHFLRGAVTTALGSEFPPIFAIDPCKHTIKGASHNPANTFCCH